MILISLLVWSELPLSNPFVINSLPSSSIHCLYPQSTPFIFIPLPSSSFHSLHLQSTPFILNPLFLSSINSLHLHSTPFILNPLPSSLIHSLHSKSTPFILKSLFLSSIHSLHLYSTPFVLNPLPSSWIHSFRPQSTPSIINPLLSFLIHSLLRQSTSFTINPLPLPTVGFTPFTLNSFHSLYPQLIPFPSFSTYSTPSFILNPFHPVPFDLSVWFVELSICWCYGLGFFGIGLLSQLSFLPYKMKLFRMFCREEKEILSLRLEIRAKIRRYSDISLLAERNISGFII